MSVHSIRSKSREATAFPPPHNVGGVLNFNLTIQLSAELKIMALISFYPAKHYKPW